MTRILAAVLLCAASSVGCSALDAMNARSPLPSHMTRSVAAPRPAIERVAYDRPAMGVADCDCSLEGGGRGRGMCGGCNPSVQECVHNVLDCDGCCGCGDGCYGGCQGGGCYGDGCYGGGRGPCQPCRTMQGMLANNCGPRQSCACQWTKTSVGGPIAGHTDAIYNFNPGPPSAQTAYPYYTTRGPRDFFLDNPPSIGPY